MMASRAMRGIGAARCGGTGHARMAEIRDAVALRGGDGPLVPAVRRDRRALVLSADNHAVDPASGLIVLASEDCDGLARAPGQGMVAPPPALSGTAEAEAGAD